MPLLVVRGLNLKLGEAHVLFGSHAVYNERVALNISVYKALAIGQGLLSYPDILASYLRGRWGHPYGPAGKWKINGGAAGVLADPCSQNLISLLLCKFLCLLGFLLTYSFVFFNSFLLYLRLLGWFLSGLPWDLWSETVCFLFWVAARDSLEFCRSCVLPATRLVPNKLPALLGTLLAG